MNEMSGDRSPPIDPPMRYRLFGLTIESGIALPELVATSAAGPADATILRGSVAHPKGESRIGLFATGSGDGIVEVPGVGRFAIGHSQIMVDADPAAPDRNVRLFLLGSAIGALLHRRRLLPLHANAIALGSGAIAVMGRSGAGKSTLAAAFHDRGLMVLSDDICVVGRSRQGDMLAQPGIPRIRLRPDAILRSGRDPEHLELAFEGSDKRVMPAPTGTPEPLKLIAAFAIDDADDDRIACVRLQGADALMAIMNNVYRAHYVPLVGDPATHLADCAVLARAVPIFALRRPWDAERIDAIIDCLVETAASVA